MQKNLFKFLITVIVCLFFATSEAQTISITVSPSDTICSGTSVTFTAVATGGTHYQWLKNSVVVTGATNNTYITTTLVNGDVAMCELLSAPGGSIIALSNPIVMTVDHFPSVLAITGADTVCRTATTTLADATAGGVWNTSNAFIASVSSSGVVTGVAPGLDTITYSVSNLCGSASATLALYVNTPPLVAPIAGPATVCMGSTAMYIDTSAVGVWNASTPGVGTINSSGLFTPASVGIDTILYSATNACGTTTRRRPITVATAPVVPPIMGSTSVCQNDTIHLRDIPGGNWRSMNNAVAGVAAGGAAGNVGVVRGFLGGTATIVYLVANACGVDSATVDITVNPLPLVYPIIGRDTVCPGDSVGLLEVTTGGIWSTMNGSIATISGTNYAVGLTTGVDTIYYSVTNSCGTVTQAFGLAVYCPADVRVPVVAAAKEITIYPNPAHDQFQIAGVDAALVQVVNVYGQTVSGIRNSNTIPVSNLAEGIYFVTVYDGNGVVVAKERVVKM